MLVEYGGWAVLVFALSVVFGLVATLVIYWVVSRLPVDHFLDGKKPNPFRSHPLYPIWFVFKNLLGWALIIAGVIMIITPGPGFLSILIGLSLADVPHKRRLMLCGLKLSSVRKSLNWLRKLAKAEPLKFPAECDATK